MYNADRVTEGVARDTSDSARDIDVIDADNDGTGANPENDDTDARIAAAQPSLSRTHEKADMAVVSAAYPGEL